MPHLVTSTVLRTRLEDAVSRWRALLSPAHVLTGDAAAELVTDTDWREPRSFIVLRPADREQVRAVVAIAAELKIPVYPVSTGRNWGYGGGYPPTAQTQVILHLGRLDRVVDFDPVCGLVTLEPGVTQGQLADFLARNGDRFMTPTTGAGPGCSLVGNALERGYGLTPYADHFAAVMGLEAILPDGRIYHSPLVPRPSESGPLGHYKWGCGPYLDGLFSQGAFGIVTRMTIALARRPERVESFYFWIKRDEDLEAATDRVQDLLASAGGLIGGINLVSADRVALMVEPKTSLPRAAWVGTGALYGDAGQVVAARKSVKKRLAPVASSLLFLNRGRLRLIERAIAPLVRSLRPMIHSTASVLSVLEGKPTEFALPLAYALRRDRLPKHDLNPGRDGCGLLWYAPIIPMRGSSARDYISFVGQVCARHGFKAAITLSSLSSTAFDSTLPLLFEPTAENSVRAHACLSELFRDGKTKGFFPYRYGAAAMSEATSTPDVFWGLASDLKRVVDPDGLFSPGRYHRQHS